MEVPGTPYLLNLSILAITFAAVSALVMLIRQTMGGKLSNFDVYLITSFVSFGFVIAVDAILPALLALFNPRLGLLWIIASCLAAAALGAVVGYVLGRRTKASSEPMPRTVLATFATQGLAVVLLLANAVLQNAGLFAGALTLSLMAVMLSFVRRISSLVGEKPGEDWDPKRG